MTELRIRSDMTVREWLQSARKFLPDFALRNFFAALFSLVVYSLGLQYVALLIYCWRHHIPTFEALDAASQYAAAFFLFSLTAVVVMSALLSAPGLVWHFTDEDLSSPVLGKISNYEQRKWMLRRRVGLFTPGLAVLLVVVVVAALLDEQGRVLLWFTIAFDLTLLGFLVLSAALSRRAKTIDGVVANSGVLLPNPLKPPAESVISVSFFSFMYPFLYGLLSAKLLIQHAPEMERVLKNYLGENGNSVELITILILGVLSAFVFAFFTLWVRPLARLSAAYFFAFILLAACFLLPGFGAVVDRVALLTKLGGMQIELALSKDFLDTWSNLDLSGASGASTNRIRTHALRVGLLGREKLFLRVGRRDGSGEVTMLIPRSAVGEIIFLD